MNKEHILKIDIEEEIYNNIFDEEWKEELSSEELDEIVRKTKEYIFEDDSFWNKLDSCVIDAIDYVRRRRNKTNEQY